MGVHLHVDARVTKNRNNYDIDPDVAIKTGQAVPIYGMEDYAYIRSFQVGQDKIQLSGQAGDYLIADAPYNCLGVGDRIPGLSSATKALFLNNPGNQPDDLIAIITTSSGVLNYGDLTNANIFTFV